MTRPEIQSKLRELVRETKRLRRQLRTEAITHRSTRAECEERADGACEVRAFGDCRGALEHDHFFGRGKEKPNMRLEWMLCSEHHRRKTENRPSRAWWLGVFQLHASAHGYEEVVNKCEAALALERAQHSEAVR